MAAFFRTALTICFLAVPMLARAEDINAIRFPENAWDPELLALIDKGPYFLSKDEDIAVPPPPLNDSAETKAELDTLRHYQAEERTPETVQQILEENEKRFNLSGHPRGKIIDSALAFSLRELDYFVMKAKREYARPRPTQLAPDLTAVIPVPAHAAYPSGHAAQYRMIARVYSAIDPEKMEFYQSHAAEIARRREIAGLHYPGDSRAGKDLADAVFEKMSARPEYGKLIETAREEFVAGATEEKNLTTNGHE